MSSDYYPDSRDSRPSETAIALGTALHALNTARASLDAAVSATEDEYLGQHDPIDFYRDEQEEYNAALIAYEDAVAESVARRMLPAVKEIAAALSPDALVE